MQALNQGWVQMDTIAGDAVGIREMRARDYGRGA